MWFCWILSDAFFCLYVLMSETFKYHSYSWYVRIRRNVVFISSASGIRFYNSFRSWNDAVLRCGTILTILSLLCQARSCVCMRSFMAFFDFWQVVFVGDETELRIIISLFSFYCLTFLVIVLCTQSTVCIAKSNR